MEPKQVIAHFLLNSTWNPYIFAGNGPLVDCSGFVIQGLRAAGFGPPRDMTSQELFDYYAGFRLNSVREFGALSFYGSSRSAITHVAWCLNSYQCVEAAGGDRTTTTVEAAQARAAMIRVRLIDDFTGRDGRRDLVDVLLPVYNRVPMG